MLKSDRELITELKAVLTSQQYSPVVVGNYCAYARGLLDHLERQNILAADVTEAQVEQYLRDAVGLFQQHRGRRPGPRWVKAALQARLAECQLELHPTKTKIVYCRDSKRRGQHPNVTFDFLGYCFRPRAVWGTQSGRLFCGFTPAVSSSALKAMREKIRDLHIRRQTQLSLNDIARLTNPLLRGWISYYGRYAPTGLQPILRYVNQTVLAWARRKFKRFGRGKARASRFLQRIVEQRTDLFVHWQLGLIGRFA